MTSFRSCSPFLFIYLFFFHCLALGSFRVQTKLLTVIYLFLCAMFEQVSCEFRPDHPGRLTFLSNLIYFVKSI